MKTAHTLAAATVLIVILSSLPAAATPNPTAGDPVRAALGHTMAVDAWPAGLVAVRDTNEEVSTYASGVRELGWPEKVRADSQIRIGSNTKTFTSAIVLQLVGEGAISLDEAVETYLPGVVQHPQVTGHDITIRQLLQHTSGLPDMDGDIGDHLLEWQHRYISPRASLDLALTHPVSNAPGARFEYSNSNYILAGLIIEAVAGRPLAEEIDKRIITPLGLEDTYFPNQGEQIIRGPHPHSYIPLRDSPVDFTDFDPSWGYAAGALVSTTEDLTAFYSALATGEVVDNAQLEDMRLTIPADSLWDGASYGLGLISFDLSCGVTAWGHGGDVPGTVSRVAATDDGRAAAIAVTQNATSAEADRRLRTLIDTAICTL